MIDKSIAEVQQEIIEEFELFEDWMDKYKHIIDNGKKLPELSDDYKINDYKIKGCQSNVWLHPEMEGDKVAFSADSEAAIVKGLIALLIRVYSGRKPSEILDNDPEFIEKIGMREHLSPTRSNGLHSMIRQMKLYALAYQKGNEQPSKQS